MTKQPFQIHELLEDWYDKDFDSLPPELQTAVRERLLSGEWELLSEINRRKVFHPRSAEQHAQFEANNQLLWDFLTKIENVEREINKWEVVAAATASDLDRKESALEKLRAERDRLKKAYASTKIGTPAQPADWKPGQDGTGPPPSDDGFMDFVEAMKFLEQRFDATVHELAGWVFDGRDGGGINAYKHQNEFDPPLRFYYDSLLHEDGDYVEPLVHCSFRRLEVENFDPGDNRYITGTELLERWSDLGNISATSIIQSSIQRSELLDLHPIYGATQAGDPEEALPPLEAALFPLPLVLKIEDDKLFKPVFRAAENQRSGNPSPNIVDPKSANPETEFSEPNQENDSVSQYLSKRGKHAADARHDKPGGSRDKQAQIKAIWASGKYSSKDICAEQECAGLKMSFKAARNALINEPKPTPSDTGD